MRGQWRWSCAGRAAFGLLAVAWTVFFQEGERGGREGFHQARRRKGQARSGIKESSRLPPTSFTVPLLIIRPQTTLEQPAACQSLLCVRIFTSPVAQALPELPELPPKLHLSSTPAIDARCPASAAAAVLRPPCPPCPPCTAPCPRVDTAGDAASSLAHRILLRVGRKQCRRLSAAEPRWVCLSQALHWRESSFPSKLSWAWPSHVTADSTTTAEQNSNNTALHRKSDIAPCRSISAAPTPSITSRSSRRPRRASR